jgi:hypothetical protein
MYKTNIKIFGACWSMLGFKRGMDLYDYEYNKYKYIYYPYSYISKINSGITGSVIYINPICLFFTIPKEIYRLEVTIRGIELKDESMKDDFYSLL